ncbi:hypothetical protein C8J56DRAFT_278930 [Mycena floridula]|nr:hypothetical protein C8J56DRAFT_278930 [Mycena floridula]
MTDKTEKSMATVDHNADLILRTTDDIDFHIQRIFLTLQSPVFATMFTLPQPTNESAPTIPFPRSAHDLSLLMGYCDPRNVPSTELEDMQCVLEMADQFEMEHIIARVAKKLENSPELIEKEPFKVFAIATQHRLEKIAQLAAKETLRFPMVERRYIPEMTRISAAALQHLNDYYFACCAAVGKHLSDSNWIPEASPFRYPEGLTCFPLISHGGNEVRLWVAQHIDNARALYWDRPSPSLFAKLPARPNQGQHWQCRDCEVCRVVVPVEFDIFRQQFGAAVDEAVSAVHLETHFI